MNSTLLLEKNGFCLYKKEDGEYFVTFSLANENLLLPNIVGFDLIQLVYDLNPDIYEKLVYEKNKETENQHSLNVFLLMKPLFQDLGISQKYCHLQITQTKTDKDILYEIISINDSIQGYNAIEQLPIENILFKGKIVNPHQINFTIEIQLLKKKVEIPEYLEKLACMLIVKILSRVKQFIENICI
jgi:hypothetical protein